ncbi:hypothetical protein BLA29_002037 [Euroglyphus maynei]|uniref:Leucine carboxyl methyltransferase 1 n=1 Tax=Euroglyphus maynei TaxID=6958 RepID=A0A1Y3B7P9_EURMA|nr:hypothetical protein BLA29_002037 [Euroglyphus maynei]
MYSNTEWTNNEASRTKLWLSQQGYIDDPFVKYFCQNPMKRAPEINRGYFARVYAITHSVKRFCLRDGANCQIVNIGSGFDTIFWRLIKNPDIKFSRYVDVDTNEVIDHKIRTIQKNEELLKFCGQVEKSSSSQFLSERYNAISLDATKSMQLVRQLLQECRINKSDPIIFIFECVLLYWPEESTTNLIYTLNKTFNKCNFVIFDLVNTKDKFSDLMQQSLVEQQTPLLGANSFRSIDDWRTKLSKIKCLHVHAWIMNDVYYKLIDQNERERIEKIEFFDEIELMLQLFNHYCLVMASNYSDFDW